MNNIQFLFNFAEKQIEMNTSKILYRRANVSDRPFLTKALLEAAAASETYIEINEISNYPDVYAYVKDFPSSHEVGVIAETAMGELVGAVWLVNLPFHDHVVKYPMPELTIYVCDEYRKKGIASNLLDCLYEFASQLSIKEISLGVYHKNKVAINLYLKHDWIIDGKINNDEYLMMSRVL